MGGNNSNQHRGNNNNQGSNNNNQHRGSNNNGNNNNPGSYSSNNNGCSNGQPGCGGNGGCGVGARGCADHVEGNGGGVLFPLQGNSGYGADQGSVSPVQPPNPRQPSQSQPRPYQSQPRPQQSRPAKRQPAQTQSRPVQPRPQQSQSRPAQRQPTQSQPRPAQRQPQQTQSRPVQQQGNFAPANTKPYVKCPSAMKCVERRFCDFNGVMTNDELILTRDLEMLRVPLIDCVNRERKLC